MRSGSETIHYVCSTNLYRNAKKMFTFFAFNISFPCTIVQGYIVICVVLVTLHELDDLAASVDT